MYKIHTKVFLVIICSLFSGCYTLSQGVTMLGYLNRAIPLEQVEDEEFVWLVNDIRKFAIEELGLAMSKNYTRFVELDRNYLAAVVSASQKDSFRRHEWRFPIVGALPYKGFFDIEDALKQQAKLEKKDMDVWVRRVDGFSTLGWFKDPLFSYMRYYSPERLANLIIHELVHATVFIKGQIQFNEELAEFIGTAGSRLYIKSRFGLDSEEYQRMFTTEDESYKFIAFVQELIANLEVLYSGDLNREEILIQKESIIKAAQERFDIEYDSRFSDDNYRGFSQLPVNNAYLEIFRLYHAGGSYLAELYERSGEDLIMFITAAKTITKRGGSPIIQLERALGLN